MRWETTVPGMRRKGSKGMEGRQHKDKLSRRRRRRTQETTTKEEWNPRHCLLQYIEDQNSTVLPKKEGWSSEASEPSQKKNTHQKINARKQDSGSCWWYKKLARRFTTTLESTTNKQMSIFVQLEKNQTRKETKKSREQNKYYSSEGKGREGKQQQLASMRVEREREREQQLLLLLPTWSNRKCTSKAH
jgi:hypothetical protein